MFNGDRRECPACRSMEKRTTNKKILVEYKGGKCIKCGYNENIEALQFHHRNPKDKEYNISEEMKNKKIDELKKEADKCDLLCANCHIIEHLNNDRRKFII